MPEIEDINRAIATGGKQYWRAIYQAYFTPLTRFLQSKFESLPGDMAEELASRTLLKLADRARPPVFGHHNQFMAWLLTAARNLALDYFRSVAGKGRQNTRLMESFDEFLVEVPDEGGGDTRVAKRVARVLAELGERERRILVMRADGTPYDVIARDLDIQENAARTYFFRAKARFQTLYAAELGREC